MSRKDALLKLHSRLLTQREALRRKIADDMGLAYSQDDGINDVGEAAMQLEQSELHTQLAALESREIRQIDAAIQQIQTGTYGICDTCQKPIPISRLQALPFTSHCVTCQRKAELRRSRFEDETEEHWASALEYERRSNDRELSLEDIHID